MSQRSSNGADGGGIGKGQVALALLREGPWHRNSRS